jgi:hypothetical protein
MRYIAEIVVFFVYPATLLEMRERTTTNAVAEA